MKRDVCLDLKSRWHWKFVFWNSWVLSLNNINNGNHQDCFFVLQCNGRNLHILSLHFTFSSLNSVICYSLQTQNVGIWTGIILMLLMALYEDQISHWIYQESSNQTSSSLNQTKYQILFLCFLQKEEFMLDVMIKCGVLQKYRMENEQNNPKV